MKETLKKFHHSIIVKQASHATQLLKTNPRISKEKQMAVYIDGYRIRLSSAVRSDHKAFCNYLGKKSEKVVSQFVEEVTSDSYSLDFYPFKFTDYLLNKKIKPEAKELARLEAAIATTFMAKDSEPLMAQTLSNLNESQLESFRFKPRTALALLELDHDVEKYLQEFRAEQNPKKIAKKKNYICVVRNNNEIHRHYLLAEEYEVLQKLFAGLSTEEAVSNEMTIEMFPQWLQKWLINGFFAG